MHTIYWSWVCKRLGYNAVLTEYQAKTINTMFNNTGVIKQGTGDILYNNGLRWMIDCHIVNNLLYKVTISPFDYLFILSLPPWK